MIVNTKDTLAAVINMENNDYTKEEINIIGIEFNMYTCNICKNLFNYEYNVKNCKHKLKKNNSEEEQEKWDDENDKFKG